MARFGAAGRVRKRLFRIKSALCEQTILPIASEHFKITQHPRRPGRHAAQIYSQHRCIQNRFGKILRVLLQIKCADTAAHGMCVQIQRQIFCHRLHHCFDEPVQIFYISGKQSNVYNCVIFHFTHGFSMPSVIHNRHLISLQIKIVNQFMIFQAGLCKAIADHDRPFLCLLRIQFIIQTARLSRFSLSHTVFWCVLRLLRCAVCRCRITLLRFTAFGRDLHPPANLNLFQKRLYLAVHFLFQIFFCDTLHSAGIIFL